MGVFPTAVAMQLFVADRQYPVVHSTLVVDEEMVPIFGKDKFKILKENKS